jgi:hypothetical protein
MKAFYRRVGGRNDREGGKDRCRDVEVGRIELMEDMFMLSIPVSVIEDGI